MNRRVAEEYNNYGDVASGLRVFVEQLNEKNQSFGEYVSQIDAIDQQVTEFEAVVSMLDKHVSLLEKKVKSAYNIAPTQWIIVPLCMFHFNFCHMSLSKRGRNQTCGWEFDARYLWCFQHMYSSMVLAKLWCFRHFVASCYSIDKWQIATV